MNDVFPVVVSFQRQPRIRLSRGLPSLEAEEFAWPIVLRKNARLDISLNKSSFVFFFLCRQLLAKNKYSAQDILSLRERFH